MFTPPPPPVVAPATVVAGPVLSAGRMVWVQEADNVLSVRVQARAGGVRTVATLPPPAGLPASETLASQDLQAFAVSGRRIALVRVGYGSFERPCADPCYSLLLPPPRPYRSVYQRGTFARLRTVRRTGEDGRCKVPLSLGWVNAGVVEDRCTGGAGPDRLSVAGRPVARGTLRGAAGRWIAWNRDAQLTVRRVPHGHHEYSVPVQTTLLNSFNEAGTLGANGSVAAVVSQPPGPCASGNYLETQLGVASPRHPALSIVATGDAYKPFAVFNGSLAYVGVPPYCGAAEPVMVADVGGAITHVGDTLAPTRIAIDREEVAVLDDSGLHRYAR